MIKNIISQTKYEMEMTSLSNTIKKTPRKLMNRFTCETRILKTYQRVAK